MAASTGLVLFVVVNALVCAGLVTRHALAFSIKRGLQSAASEKNLNRCTFFMAMRCTISCCVSMIHSHVHAP
jgi:hypothetical protein